MCNLLLSFLCNRIKHNPIKPSNLQLLTATNNNDANRFPVKIGSQAQSIILLAEYERNQSVMRSKKINMKSFIYFSPKTSSNNSIHLIIIRQSGSGTIALPRKPQKENSLPKRALTFSENNEMFLYLLCHYSDIFFVYLCITYFFELFT